MGLREKKAQRTRAQIVDVALGLFVDKGYDATTMEEIAELAEVGTSTLYRYFPAKDQILFGALEEADTVADRLRARPADEPLPVALGHAVRDTLAITTIDDRRLLTLRAIVDRAAGPRAHLWDILAQQRALLEAAVAERVGSEPDDIGVVMSARIAMLIMEIAGDQWRDGDQSRSIADLADDIMLELAVTGVVLPVAPRDQIQ